MKTRNNIAKLLAVAAATVAVTGISSVAVADVGSTSRIQNAINTTSTVAIIGELERAEQLVCSACIPVVMKLLDDPRYEVREVAAWWFARRPAQAKEIHIRSVAALQGSDAILARNAADILGAFNHPKAVSVLAAAAARTDLGPEAQAHAVMALGLIGHPAALPAIQKAATSTDPTVRYQAAVAWGQLRGVTDVAGLTPLVGDADVSVRRQAISVIGLRRFAGARLTLEAQLASDADPATRRNAAWALGRIGDRASYDVLDAAMKDSSSLVRMTARAAKRMLR